MVQHIDYAERLRLHICERLGWLQGAGGGSLFSGFPQDKYDAFLPFVSTSGKLINSHSQIPASRICQMDDSVLYAAKNSKMLIALRLNEDDDGSNQSCDLLRSQLETRCAKPSFLRNFLQIQQRKASFRFHRRSSGVKFSLSMDKISASDVMSP